MTLTGTISFVICLYLAVWVPLGVAFDGGNTAAILCPSLAALFFVCISMHHGMFSFNGVFFQCQFDLVLRKPDFVACEQQSRGPASLISAFVIRLLENMISYQALCKISKF